MPNPTRPIRLPFPLSCSACPIGQPNPTCPGFPSQPCVPFTYSCPPPPCQVDAECVPLRCLRPPPPPLAGQQQQQSVVGVCQDFPEPSPHYRIVLGINSPFPEP